MISKNFSLQRRGRTFLLDVSSRQPATWKVEHHTSPQYFSYTKRKYFSMIKQVSCAKNQASWIYIGRASTVSKLCGHMFTLNVSYRYLLVCFCEMLAVYHQERLNAELPSPYILYTTVFVFISFATVRFACSVSQRTSGDWTIFRCVSLFASAKLARSSYCHIAAKDSSKFHVVQYS